MCSTRYLGAIAALVVGLFGLAEIAIATPPPTLWDTTIGGSNSDELNYAVETADGGFLLGGMSSSPPCGASPCPGKDAPHFGNGDYWVVKLDANGQKEWDRSFGGSAIDELFVVREVTGGYLLGGRSASPAGSGNKTAPLRGIFDYWIVKIDATGSYLWDASFGGTGSDVLQDLVEVSTGGFLLGGRSQSGPGGNKTAPNYGHFDYWVVKTNAAGGFLWDASFGGNNLDWLFSVNETDDGGFLLGGLSHSAQTGTKTTPNRGDADYWAVKVSASGGLQWETNMGGDDRDEMTDAIQTVDGGYILAGWSWSGATFDKSEPNRGIASTGDYWIVKLDPVGTPVWNRTYGGDNLDELWSVSEEQYGALLLNGWSTSSISGEKTEANVGSADFWMLRLDGFGNILYDEAYGSADTDRGKVIAQTSDDGYFLAGQTSTNPAQPPSGDRTASGFGGFDYWILRLGTPTPSPCTGSAVINASGPLTFCSLYDVTLDVAPHVSVVWQPGLQTTSTLTVNTSGIYSAQVTDVDGCVYSAAPVTVTVTPGSFPPSNDDLCNGVFVTQVTATPIIGQNAFSYDTDCASVQSGEFAMGIGSGVDSCESQDGWCASDPDPQTTLWYIFEAPASGKVRIDAGPGDVQLGLWGDLFSCDPADLLPIAANDDLSGPGAARIGSICAGTSVVPGDIYAVQLDAKNAMPSTGTLSIIDAGVPPPVNFDNPTVDCSVVPAMGACIDITSPVGIDPNSITLIWSLPPLYGTTAAIPNALITKTPIANGYRACHTYGGTSQAGIQYYTFRATNLCGVPGIGGGQFYLDPPGYYANIEFQGTVNGPLSNLKLKKTSSCDCANGCGGGGAPGALVLAGTVTLNDKLELEDVRLCADLRLDDVTISKTVKIKNVDLHADMTLHQVVAGTGSKVEITDSCLLDNVTLTTVNVAGELKLDKLHDVTAPLIISQSTVGPSGKLKIQNSSVGAPMMLSSLFIFNGDMVVNDVTAMGPVTATNISMFNNSRISIDDVMLQYGRVLIGGLVVSGGEVEIEHNDIIGPTAELVVNQGVTVSGNNAAIRLHYLLIEDSRVQVINGTSATGWLSIWGSEYRNGALARVDNVDVAGQLALNGNDVTGPGTQITVTDTSVNLWLLILGSNLSGGSEVVVFDSQFNASYGIYDLTATNAARVHVLSSELNAHVSILGTNAKPLAFNGGEYVLDEVTVTSNGSLVSTDGFTIDPGGAVRFERTRIEWKVELKDSFRVGGLFRVADSVILPVSTNTIRLDLLNITPAGVIQLEDCIIDKPVRYQSFTLSTVESCNCGGAALNMWHTNNSLNGC